MTVQSLGSSPAAVYAGGGDIQLAAAVKAQKLARQQGEQLVQLIEQAADQAPSPGGNGRGGSIDVYA